MSFLIVNVRFRFFLNVVSPLLTTDLDWSFQLEKIRLTDENFSRFGAEILHVFLIQLNALARLLAPHFEELGDHCVDLVVLRLHLL